MTNFDKHFKVLLMTTTWVIWLESHEGNRKEKEYLLNIICYHIFPRVSTGFIVLWTYDYYFLL